MPETLAGGATALIREIAAGGPACILLAKLTLLLACCWALHAALARANARWRAIVWRALVPAAAFDFKETGRFPRSWAISPDDKRLAVGFENGQVLIWDMDSLAGK